MVNLVVWALPTNLWAFAGVAVMVVLQMLYTYLPMANRIFQSAPITLGDWAQILVVAVTVYLLVEFEKGLRRRKRARTNCSDRTGKGMPTPECVVQ